MKVYSRHRQQNPRPAAQRAHQIARDGERADARTAKRRGGGDDALQLLVHALLAMPRHHEPLLLELLGDIARRGAADLDPGLGKQRAGGQHEGDVDGAVQRVVQRRLEVQRRRHVVGDAGGGVQLRGAALARLPDAEQLHEQVVGEAAVEHLADEEDVAGERRLQHDGHVGGVEEAHGVGAAHAALARALERDLNTEALQVDDGGEDE